MSAMNDISSPLQMSANTLRRAAKVAKIDFVEMEFSPFETAIEVSRRLSTSSLPAIIF